MFAYHKVHSSVSYYILRQKLKSAFVRKRNETISTGMFTLAALVKLQRFTQRLFEWRANVLSRIKVSDIEMFNDVLNNLKKKPGLPFGHYFVWHVSLRWLISFGRSSWYYMKLMNTVLALLFTTPASTYITAYSVAVPKREGLKLDRDKVKINSSTSIPREPSEVAK